MSAENSNHQQNETTPRIKPGDYWFWKLAGLYGLFSFGVQLGEWI